MLRWWCVTTLGHRWNTLVIVVPDAPLVRRGPYRWLHHPNYVAVVVEGIALPLVHTAWLTAVCFTVANALLLGGADQGGEPRAGDDAVNCHHSPCPATGFSAAPTYSPIYPPPSKLGAFVSTIVKSERLRL